MRRRISLIFNFTFHEKLFFWYWIDHQNWEFSSKTPRIKILSILVMRLWALRSWKGPLEKYRLYLVSPTAASAVQKKHLACNCCLGSIAKACTYSHVTLLKTFLKIISQFIWYTMTIISIQKFVFLVRFASNFIQSLLLGLSSV